MVGGAVILLGLSWLAYLMTSTGVQIGKVDPFQWNRLLVFNDVQTSIVVAADALLGNAVR